MMSEVKAPLYVALVGAAGSGKTTHCKLLQAKYKGDVLSFATPLKKVLRDIWGERMDDPEFARQEAQRLGTEYARAIDRNVWIRKLEDKISPNRNVFVDDCRFYNEFAMLKRNGFIFVRLTAQPAILAQRRPTLTVEQATHISETENNAFNVDGYLSTDPDPAVTEADDIKAKQVALQTLVQRIVEQRRVDDETTPPNRPMLVRPPLHAE